MKITYLDTYIETARLYIRPLKSNDLEAFKEGFAQRKPKQNAYDADDIDVSGYTRATFKEVIQSLIQLAADDESYIFAIFLKDSHLPIGKVEFTTLLREPFNWGMVGYVLNNSYWGRGYGSEAVTAAVQYALQHLNYHRIEAHITPDNSRSIRTAENAGLSFECIREKFIQEENGWIDKSIYVINN